MRMGREPSAARRVIRPWPISPLAPVMRTTGFRIWPGMLAPRAAVAFSRRDEGLRGERNRGDDRLQPGKRHVRPLVPVLPLDRADGTARLGGAPRVGHGGAGPLEAPARPRGHLQQRRSGAGRRGHGPARRENRAHHGFQAFAALDRSSPLFRPEATLLPRSCSRDGSATNSSPPRIARVPAPFCSRRTSATSSSAGSSCVSSASRRMPCMPRILRRSSKRTGRAPGARWAWSGFP